MTELTELIKRKAEISSLLNVMPYDGSIDIKESGCTKYIYLRKRIKTN